MKISDFRTERPPRFLSPTWGERMKKMNVVEKYSVEDRTEGLPVVAVDIREEEKNENYALISFSKHDRVEVNR